MPKPLNIKLTASQAQASTHLYRPMERLRSLLDAEPVSISTEPLMPPPLPAGQRLRMTLGGQLSDRHHAQLKALAEAHKTTITVAALRLLGIPLDDKNSTLKGDKINLVVSVTARQYESLPPKPIKALGRVLTQHINNAIPFPKPNLHPVPDPGGVAHRIGGALSREQHTKLKELAKGAELSMSKAAIRLLQLPE